MPISMAIAGLLLVMVASLTAFVVHRVSQRATHDPCLRRTPSIQGQPGWVVLAFFLILVASLSVIVMSDFLRDRANYWVMRDPTFDWIAPLVTATLMVAGLIWLLLRYPQLRLRHGSLRGCSTLEGARYVGSYLFSGFGLVAGTGLLLWLTMNGLAGTLAWQFAGSASTRIEVTVEQTGHSGYKRTVRQYALLRWPSDSSAQVRIETSMAGESWADELGLHSVLRVNGFCDLADLATGARLIVTGRPSRLGFAIDRIDSVQAGDRWCQR